MTYLPFYAINYIDVIFIYWSVHFHDVNGNAIQRSTVGQTVVISNNFTNISPAKGLTGPACLQPTLREMGKYNHHNVDFSPLRKDPSGAWIDKVVLHIVREQIVEGHWQTEEGYNITYSGLMDIVMEVKSAKQILSIQEVPLPDESYQYSFTEKEKDVIGFVLSNDTVREMIVAKRTQGLEPYFGGMRYIGSSLPESPCHSGSCARVMVYVENTKQALAVVVNTDADKVVSLNTSREWVENCQTWNCEP